MKEEKVNVNGRRLNKLEEVIKLIQKLNEDHYTEQEREEYGYPIHLVLLASGEGNIYDRSNGRVILRFENIIELEEFLKADRRTQLEFVHNTVLRGKQ